MIMLLGPSARPRQRPEAAAGRAAITGADGTETMREHARVVREIRGR